jgi:hypothetical protein
MDEPPGKGQAEARTGRVVIAGPAAAPALAASGVAVLVAGDDASAVGEAVAALRAVGCDAAGWVGDLSAQAVREMAAELFPGAEITFAARP